MIKVFKVLFASSCLLSFFTTSIFSADQDWRGTVGQSTPKAGSVTTLKQTTGAGAATFDANGVISSVSDARMKNVQGSFDAGLAEILALDPKLFTYKLESGLDTENIYAGLIAQNVMGVIPQAVGKNLDGIYSLQDRPIIAALINAIKALQAEIEALGGATVNPAVPQIGEAGIIQPTKHYSV